MDGGSCGPFDPQATTMQQSRTRALGQPGADDAAPPLGNERCRLRSKGLRAARPMSSPLAREAGEGLGVRASSVRP